MKPEIIPAILPKDFAELEAKLELIRGLAKTVQIDICDGQFVPNATWPYKKRDDSFEKIVEQAEGLPGWQDLNFEFDLMVNKPEEVVQDWVSAGATRIIIHAESRGSVEEAVAHLRDRAEIALALNIETPIDVIEKYKDAIVGVQCMGIDHIGFQGQDFDSKVIKKVRQIKAKYPDLIVSVDGGVSLANARSLVEAGASRLTVGSAIFESDNIVETIDKFKKLTVL